MNLTHCDNQSKDFSPVNAIKIIINHLQHTFPHTIKHTLTLYPSKSSEITTNHRHFRKYQISRGTQFNLTLCDLPIKRLLASKRNQIYSEVSSTHISDTIKHTLTLYPSKSSEITTKSQTFQQNIRLLAEHNSIWHFAIYQSKLFSPLNAIKYILKHLQHTFPHNIKHTLTLYPSKSSEITLNHRHFRKLSDFSQNTIQFDTLRFTNQKTSRL